MIKVLIATSECVPFIKTGGLADVAGALPKYCDKEKYDIRVVLPKYECLKPQYKDSLRYIKYFYINMEGRDQYVGLFEAEHDGVKFYFIDNEEHFSGDKPYSGMPWDLGKFTFFCKATLSMLPEIQFKPDIIHCNDWETALIPAFLPGYKAQFRFYSEMKTIMTIHNLKFQGIWNIDDVRRITGLDSWYFEYDKLEFYGMSNFLKGGIAFADRVTTVSKTYADEICTEQYGEGLNPLLCFRRNDLKGIVNGIDYSIYNPETDPNIYENYNIDTVIEKKLVNKLKLQEELGLEVNPDKLLLGVVSRLTDQKGFDLVRDTLNDIVHDCIQVVVIGTGEKQYEDLFRYFAEVYKQSVSANICYAEALAQKVYAGCDGFIMPSRFEPCGLSQMMSMRYGTLPIVRRTGGLADTVVGYEQDPDNATGFAFDYYNAEDFLQTVRDADRLHREDRGKWNEMVKRAMSKDFSWSASAKEYTDLYSELAGK